MRSSRAFLQRSRQWRGPETRSSALPFSSSSTLLYPRVPPFLSDRVRSQQLSSSAAPIPPEDSNNLENDDNKPKRRQVRPSAKSPDKPTDASGPLSVVLAQDDIHQILWRSSESSGKSEQESIVAGLPEPWLLQEAYEHVLLALHPQTQHKATYPFNNGSLVEPTLAFYCPIEGGDYVLDATVREVARRADADVITLDALDLAAGEHGLFGQAASVLQFPVNPLQLNPSHFASTSSTGKAFSQRDDDDDDDSPASFFMSAAPSFTIQIPSGSQSGSQPFRGTRGGNGNGTVVSPISRGSSSTASHRAKTFFEGLINLTPTGPSPELTENEPQERRPRIIYIRDFPLIAPHAHVWYPSLLAAVRSRRQGPISRPTSPVSYPTVIVFGVTPPLVQGPASFSSQSGNIFSMLSGNRPLPIKTSRSTTWSEADWKSRERRLKERLRKWRKGHDFLWDELPKLNVNPSNLGTRGSGMQSELGFMLSSIVGVPMGRGGRDGSSSASSDSSNDDFYRVVGLVPQMRNSEVEALHRRDRRLQVNETALKVAIAEAGGSLNGRLSRDDDPNAQSSLANEMSQRLEAWRDLKTLADATVGAALGETEAHKTDELLNPTPITWPQVERAFLNSSNVHGYKKAWVESASPAQSPGEDNEGQGESSKDPEVDEVLESVRKDPNLDQHEQRLLGCIVDPATMPTTFKSVHLPASTIDSVRTMVSLPLLYPDAFSTGILKTHSMTGALLFGPPGTGKTLLARAIARESGARMMIIKPSDVMDMYVGEGEKLVRSVFTLARRLSPCVVFLDEIDALFGARVSSRESGGAMAHRGIITEFMQEMDGLKSSRDQSVIVIGATNRPFDLDDAVLRRLPRRLLVDLPGPKEREAILKILLRDETLGPDVDLVALATRTEAFSGSDLKHLCISAALDAVKETVDVPWAVPSKDQVPLPDTHAAETSTPATTSDASNPSATASDEQGPGQDAASTSPLQSVPRTLGARHFVKALHEITPSASESLGTLLSIRKWNEEFGEGAKGKRRRAWGDKFGFSNAPLVEEARVSNEQPSASLEPPSH